MNIEYEHDVEELVTACEKMYGGSMSKRADAIKSLTDMFKSGNFKAGVALEAFKILGLWPVVDIALKKIIHSNINTNCRYGGAKQSVETLLKSLDAYAKQHPKEFSQLVKIASNTRNFNDNAFKCIIFIIAQCPEALDNIIKGAIDVISIYTGVMKTIPIPVRLVIQKLMNKFAKAKGYNDVLAYLGTVNANIHRKISLTSIINKVLPDRDATQEALEDILALSSSLINKAINSVDPFGVVMPVSTFVCYDIIVARVAKHKLKIPLPWWLKLCIALAVIITIAIVVTIVKNMFNKESYILNVPARLTC